MNICMVLDWVDFPPDTRVENEARALLRAGHRVFVLCDRIGDSPASALWNGIEIRRIPPLPFPIRKLNSLLYLISMRDLQWRMAIRGLIDIHSIDAIHVHDLHKVGTALTAARKKGVPVIADLHEHHPVIVRISFATGKVGLAQRLIWPARWERAETRWGKRCTHVVAVVEEMKERLVGKGIPPEKITVVENTVDVDHFLSLRIDQELRDRYKAEFVICYVGNFSGFTGLDNAIQAMPRVLGEIPNARLLLVGDGPAMDQLRPLPGAMGLDRKVTFTGRVDFDLVPTYIALSDVCLAPFRSTPQTEASAPHKLFQYMLMAKPVVVSSCRSLRRLVEDGRLGNIFTAGDSASLAQAILKLKDPAVRRKLGEAGRKAVLEKYNWGKTSQKLLALYESLAQEAAQIGNENPRGPKDRSHPGADADSLSRGTGPDVVGPKAGRVVE
jgi:glycosyltransferase involved in cell wall biosynthesis